MRLNERQSRRVKAANVILRERAPTRSVGRRLKDHPATYHNERAKTSEFYALREFDRRSVSCSLADSSVAKAPSE